MTIFATKPCATHEVNFRWASLLKF